MDSIEKEKRNADTQQLSQPDLPFTAIVQPSEWPVPWAGKEEATQRGIS